MARPRQSATILELKGSFKKHPERRRVDLPGVGEFDAAPPAHLPQELVPAWREIVAHINPLVLTGSDRLSVETMARLLLQFRMTGDKAISTELRMWFGQYGMTATGRAKLGAPSKRNSENPFADA